MIALVLLAALETPMPLPSPWAAWKYERSVVTSAHSGPSSIVVPPSLFGNAQPDLDDIRVIRRDGTAVPFAIVTPPPPSALEWKDARLTDRGFVPGRYSQIVGDLGASPPPYRTLEILTPDSSFATTVDVDASDDRGTWRTIRTGAPIYDYERDGLATNTRVAIPESTARYVRVRVMDGKRPFDFSGLRVGGDATHVPERTRYAVVAHPSSEAPSKTSVFVLEGLAQVPIDRIQIDATTASYARPVQIQIDNGTGWQTISQGTLRRTGDGRDIDSIDFPETQGRRWRITIDDGDDRPLQGLRVRAFGAPRRVDFDSDAASTYLMLYGNASAEASTFDYGKTHERKLGHALAASLGPPMRNPSFVPSTTVPWTERHRWLIWAALGIAILAVGWLSIRSLANDEHR